MAVKFTNGIDLDGTQLLNALLQPVASDPSSPADGQVWYRTDTDRFMGRANGATITLATLDDLTGGAITGALWNAQSVVVAVSDDTPVVQVIGENEMLGRTSGGDIGALTAAQVRTLLGIEAGATADLTGAEILALLLPVDGAASGLDAQFIAGTSLADLATQAELDAAIASLLDSAPGTLDTLNELAAALGDDAAFSTTVTTALGLRTQKYAEDIGDAAATAIVVTHSLGTTDVVVSVKEIATSDLVIADVDITSSNTITVTFDTAPALDAFRVVVIG